MAESLDFVEQGVEGTDLSPVFQQPTHTDLLKDAAFSQEAHCPANGTLGPDSKCNKVPLVDRPHRGMAIHRLGAVQWDGRPSSLGWRLDGRGALYDHRGDTCADFDAFENENVVDAHRDVRSPSETLSSNEDLKIGRKSRKTLKNQR